jgi:hypothetical protein
VCLLVPHFRDWVCSQSVGFIKTVKHVKDIDRNRTGTVVVTFATRADAETGEAKLKGKPYKGKLLEVCSEATFATSTELLICMFPFALFSRFLILSWIR